MRLGLTLLLLIGPMAFAPAPTPKRARGRAPELTLQSCQGSWRITKRQTLYADGKQTTYTSSVTHIRIVGDRWTFMSGSSEGSTLEISIDPGHDPALLNFYSLGGKRDHTHGIGLIRRKGSGVEVLYRWGGEEGRPRVFGAPTSGIFWTIEMQRD